MTKYYKRFIDEVKTIISNASLPDGNAVVKEGKAIAASFEVGQTLFCRQNGVSSEYEYKQKMKKKGEIMYQCQIGLDTWPETAEALRTIYAELAKDGYHIDRFGVVMERGMGLPEDKRRMLPRETGPRMEKEDDWLDLGRTVAIQPHMGDFMIGFPNSVDNTVNALKAGVTTIGNLSQYVAMNIPGWKDIQYTAIQTVKALGIMAGKKEEGTLVHSYLDDGMAALFNDHASIAGWAIVEKYIVEELIGARLGHCFGGVAVTPEIRTAWVFALNDIYDGDCCGTMYYGDTVSSTEDLTYNAGIGAQYLLWDIMAQLKCPTGHALMPVPFSEGIRIPSVDEIIEVQKFARKIEAAAKNLLPYVDFTTCYELKDKIVAGGRKFAKAFLAGLDDAGVNIEDPLQMLYVMKMVNPKTVEDAFMQGEADDTMPNGRRPVVQTDVFSNTSVLTEQISGQMKKSGFRKCNGEKKVVLASTDVHEHALFVMNSLFQEYGITVEYLGAEQDVEDIVQKAVDSKADAIAVSTHNGCAMEIGNKLMELIQRHNYTGKRFIGGMLNQGVVGETLPVEVDEQLKSLGFECNVPFGDIVKEIAG